LRQQHRLVAGAGGISAGAHLLYVLAAAVPACHDAGVVSGVGEQLSEPHHQRRLAGAADGEVAHHDHRDGQTLAREPAAAIHGATSGCYRAEQQAQREQKQVRGTNPVPEAIGDVAHHLRRLRIHGINRVLRINRIFFVMDCGAIAIRTTTVGQHPCAGLLGEEN